MRITIWLLRLLVMLAYPLVLAVEVVVRNLRHGLTPLQERAVAYYGSVALRAFGEVENALEKGDLLAQRVPFEQCG
jgi:hypothetical protein